MVALSQHLASLAGLVSDCAVAVEVKVLSETDEVSQLLEAVSEMLQKGVRPAISSRNQSTLLA